MRGSATDARAAQSTAACHEARRVGFIVFALAATLRVGFFVSLGDDPFFDRPRHDAHFYHEWGTAWAERGDAFAPEPPGEVFWRTPGYAAFVTAVYAVAGPTPRAVIALQMLIAACALGALAALATQRWGRVAGLCAGVLPMTYAPLIYLEATLLPTALATSALSLAAAATLPIVAGSQEASARAAWRAIAAGFAFGIAFALRSNLAVAALIAFALVARRHRGGPVTRGFATGLAVPLTLLAALSFAHAGTPALGGANGPMNLYFAYGDWGGPSFGAPDPSFGQIAGQADMARSVAARELGLAPEALSRSAASQYLGVRALHWIAANPGAAAVLALEKLLAVFTWRDLAINAPLAASLSVHPWLAWLAMPFPLLATLALYGSLRDRAARDALLIGFVPVVVTALLFFSYTRFRVPAVPLLGLAAAGGLHATLRGLASQPTNELRRLAGLVLATAVLVALSWDPHLRQQQRAQGYIDTYAAEAWSTLGAAYEARYERSRGDSEAGEPAWLDLAAAAYERAREIQPRFGTAAPRLARLERDQRGQRAVGCALFATLHLAGGPSGDPETAAESAVCSLLATPPEPARAAAIFDALEASGRLDPLYAEPYGDALAALGRSAEACRWLELALLQEQDGARSAAIEVRRAGLACGE